MESDRIWRRPAGLLGVVVLLACTVALSAAQSLPTTADTVTEAAVPFSSNGCSGFREAQFFTCCFVHDFAFWAGGSWTDRRRADLTLRRCVIDVGKDRARGDFAFFLVRLGIIPGVVVNDGWGRAWTGTKRWKFASLTPEQATVVAIEKTRVCRALTLDSSTGKYAIPPERLRTAPRELRAQQARAFCGAELSAR
jgi:hypothetical protein